MVSYGHYHIISDSLTHNSQETILTVGTIGSVVKIAKQELRVDETFLQCFIAFTSSIFIELFYSSLGEDLTPLPLLTKLSKGILQFDASLLSKPSTLIGSIQFVVFCLCGMVLLRQTLNYDKIFLRKV
jgi:hypothetical protein